MPEYKFNIFKRSFLCKLLQLFVLFSLSLPVIAQVKNDTILIHELSDSGFDLRLTDPDKTVTNAEKALKISKKINYQPGIGESYRIIGIGKYYIGKLEESIESYLDALNIFENIKDEEGQGKVYNNIGTLYLDNDYDQALYYYNKSLVIAKKFGKKQVIAGLHLNIGTIQMKKKDFKAALSNCMTSYKLFNQLDNQAVVTQCLNNIGVIYFESNNLKEAEKYLLKANLKAKENDLYTTVAKINLTLTSIYIIQNRFTDASKFLVEGRQYAFLSKNSKLEYDYLHTSYEFELKRKSYPKALSYLQDVVKFDSINYKNNVSDKMSLLQVQYRQREKEKQNELIIERQKNDRVMFWGISIVAVLLLGIVFLMVQNVKRKEKTNQELTRLNAEIVERTDDLDRINHHLEEMIDDRTAEVQIKNKKLEGYSLHLSHQIRGPVATLKGLMILEQENMIDKFECFEKMRKCIYDIDDQILNISHILEDKSNLLHERTFGTIPPKEPKEHNQPSTKYL